jgi:hypothetical protein
LEKAGEAFEAGWDSATEERDAEDAAHDERDYLDGLRDGAAGIERLRERLRRLEA